MLGAHNTPLAGRERDPPSKAEDTVKTYPLYIPCPVCGATPNNYCRDLVTNVQTMTFHSARVTAAQE